MFKHLPLGIAEKLKIFINVNWVYIVYASLHESLTKVYKFTVYTTYFGFPSVNC